MIRSTRAAVIILSIVFVTGTGLFADSLTDNNTKLKVRSVIPLQVRAFELNQVRLLDGPFKHAQELDRQYLLSLEPDRLLHTFRINAGLPSSAKPYGGWEEPNGELRGHFTGHYLTACAMMYAATGDEQLKARGRAVVIGLAECQAKSPNGYLSAYPESFIDRVEAQQRVWAPYYTLHKIYAGLMDMYVYCDDTQALDICKKFADWVIDRNAKLSDEQMQKMLGNEHGGMNETLANLYGLTGEKKYLDISLRFNHNALLLPAAEQRDNLTGLHANTQIPKFIGHARQYELTGRENLKTASLFFWDTVVNERSYVIGGHSDGEMFSPKERLSMAFGPSTTETCNTYNVLKLTRHLYCWDPQVRYGDYCERAIYNHILCSQNPETGMMCYYVPLRPGSHKSYNTPTDSFWCCTGTGVENHAKYGDSIYFHDGEKKIYVNLFIPSELRWKDKGLTLRQETRYPDEQESQLILICEKPVELELQIRVPWWIEKGMEVSVNGSAAISVKDSGGYAGVSRVWKTGDIVEIKMPFSLRTEGFGDNPNRLAFLYGPIVLAAETRPGETFPAVTGDLKSAIASLKPVAGKTCTFIAPQQIFHSVGQPQSKDFILEPFFRVHANRSYTVYWDRMSPEQWQAKEKQLAEELAREKALKARTVDEVQIGREQNERDHNLQGQNTASGDFGNRRWRHADNGGWFAYDLKVLPDQPQELSVTYWGSDGGNRVFDILIDGVKLTTQRLQNNKPEVFYDQNYPLPETMTKNKSKITVRFQAQTRDATAGGIFGLRILKTSEK